MLVIRCHTVPNYPSRHDQLHAEADLAFHYQEQLRTKKEDNHKDELQFHKVSRHKDGLQLHKVSRHKDGLQFHKVSRHKDGLQFHTVSRHKDGLQFHKVSRHKDGLQFHQVQTAPDELQGFSVHDVVHKQQFAHGTVLAVTAEQVQSSPRVVRLSADTFNCVLTRSTEC